MNTQPPDSLSWTITSPEAAERLRKRFWVGLGLAVGIGGPIVLGIILEDEPSGSALLWIIGLPVWVILLAYTLLQFSRPPSRDFTLSAQGVRVRKGTRSGFFSWDEFERFRFLGPKENDDAQDNDRPTSGSSYYLRVKGSGSLRKTFLVLYSEAENDARVREFLTRHLRCDPRVGDDFGLITYLFK